MTLPLRILRGAPPTTARLLITVLFTSLGDTKTALRSAATLADHLDASIEIIVTRIVPYPLPLSSPPVPVEFTRRQVSEIAHAAGVEAEVRVVDCRDREEALTRLLREHSLVVMSSRWHWLPTKQARLARLLRRKGHEVVMVDGK